MLTGRSCHCFLFCIIWIHFHWCVPFWLAKTFSCESQMGKRKRKANESRGLRRFSVCNGLETENSICNLPSQFYKYSYSLSKIQAGSFTSLNSPDAARISHCFADELNEWASAEGQREDMVLRFRKLSSCRLQLVPWMNMSHFHCARDKTVPPARQRPISRRLLREWGQEPVSVSFGFSCGSIHDRKTAADEKAFLRKGIMLYINKTCFFFGMGGIAVHNSRYRWERIPRRKQYCKKKTIKQWI